MLKNRVYLILSAFLIVSGLVLAGLSAVLSVQSLSSSEKKITESLRKNHRLIKEEFHQLVALLEKRAAHFAKVSQPWQVEAAFNLFEAAGLDPTIEGVAWLNSEFSPVIWYGNITNLKNTFSGLEENPEKFLNQSFVVQDKASYYLVLILPLPDKQFLGLFELLAFQPQFQSTYVQEFYRLKSLIRAGADINFWDLTHDTEALERLFSRTQDEYLSQQREEKEIYTLYFPLRNEKGQILATVTLNSLQVQKKRNTMPEWGVTLATFLIVSGLALFSIWLFRLARRSGSRKWLLWLSLSGSLVLIRLLLLSLTTNQPLKDWRGFSPVDLAFTSFSGLTSSPADLFLSSGFFFLFVLLSLRLLFNKPVFFVFFENSFQPENKTKTSSTVFSASASILIILGLTLVIKKIIENCNLNLLSYSFNLSALLIYLSLFLLLTGFLLPALFIIRQANPLRSHPFHLTSLFYLTGIVLLFLLGSLAGLRLTTGLMVLGLWGLLSLISAVNWKPINYLSAFLTLSTLFCFGLMKEFTEARTRLLTEKVLVHLVSSQKVWAEMVLKQSFTELQKHSRDIFNYFRRPELSPEPARYLWNKTLLARFNWNSCLYLQSSDLKLLSSFALNLPVFPEQTNDLPFSSAPTYVEQYLDVLGQEKHFLIGYQDFRLPDGPGGRLVIWVSLELELLPFFYLANPYFELLRLNTLPSLQHFPVQLSVYNQNGQLLFSQQKPGFALNTELKQKIDSAPKGLWLSFRASGRKYTGLAVKLDGKNLYLFYRPLKSLRWLITGFLKLMFLFLIFLAAGFLPGFIRRKKWQALGRSFSLRVYLAFLAVGLIPLFFFIFFSQAVVERIFSDRFVQEATSRAFFARSILHDFISLQEQEDSQEAKISEDLVFWISSTLNNDVNLFKNGLLLSSSRREFFETGILSEILDGQVYFRIAYQNQLLVVSRKSIGSYSYQTLTIPYQFGQDLYLLSLPFPFEKQEVRQATTELFEFFLFTSLFFLLLIAFSVGTIRRMIVVPINKLIRATQEVSLGNLEVKVEHQAEDELKGLVDGFNTMVESLKAHEKELAELGQKVAWTEMARRVAHEIKNPLTPIQLSAEHILKVHADKHPNFDRILQESISYIISEVENLRRIAQEFITIARESGTLKEPFDLKALIVELLQPFQNTLSDRIKFSIKENGQDFTLVGDRGKIKIALRNIIINAIEAIKGSGRIDLSLLEKAEAIELEIKDTGCGLSEVVLNHLFEPYFSTKEKGTGLGLAISKRILDEHEGTIRLESQPGKGTRVTIILPRKKEN